MKATTQFSVPGATGGVLFREWPDGRECPGGSGALVAEKWCALPEGVLTWDGPDSWRKVSLRPTSRHQSASRRLLAGFSFRVRWRESCCSWSNQACRAWSEQAHVVIRGTGLHRAHAVRLMSTNAAGTFLSSDRPSCHHGDGNAVPVSFFDGELASRVFLHSGSLHEGPESSPHHDYVDSGCWAHHAFKASSAWSVV